jgi:hypothetical protein
MNDIREPVWTAENQNRKCGDTTFDICGWCKHRGCGTMRYDTMLRGSCDLMKRYGNEVEWDTPCKIKGLGKDDLKDIVESKGYEIREHEAGIKRTNEEIVELQKLIRKAPKKPCLPDARGCDHFPLNARVWVFLNGKNIQSTTVKTGWYAGVTVNGYRSGDGCVSYVLDELPESRKGWGCGFAVPVVLLAWEYEYFKQNTGDFNDWLLACDKSYNGDKIICPAMKNLK